MGNGLILSLDLGLGLILGLGLGLGLGGGLGLGAIDETNTKNCFTNVIFLVYEYV